MWYISSPIGTICIYPDTSSGKYCLEIEGDSFSLYDSPESAADDISGFVTGNDSWDSLSGIFEPPLELSGWEYK